MILAGNQSKQRGLEKPRWRLATDFPIVNYVPILFAYYREKTLVPVLGTIPRPVSST